MRRQQIKLRESFSTICPLHICWDPLRAQAFSPAEQCLHKHGAALRSLVGAVKAEETARPGIHCVLQFWWRQAWRMALTPGSLSPFMRRANPEIEFLDIVLIKDSSLLVPAIHCPFYWRILNKIVLFSAFKNSYTKIRETRKLESIHETRQKLESEKTRVFCPETSTENAVQ
jgi:hypothetical protein